MSDTIRAAFYDFDGTLVSSNVVTRYAYFARNHPSRPVAAWRFGKLLLTVPLWLALDLYSRRLFNRLFYREYGGLAKQWLFQESEELFRAEVEPKIYPGAQALVDADRKAGFRLVLVSGGLDFALEPAVRRFGFDDLISNRLLYANGIATGQVAPPLLAEQQKVQAIHDYCRKYNVDKERSKAYSDSFSDLPMLEAVGLPAAVHPDSRLKRAANERGWAILDLKDPKAASPPRA